MFFCYISIRITTLHHKYLPPKRKSPIAIVLVVTMPAIGIACILSGFAPYDGNRNTSSPQEIQKFPANPSNSSTKFLRKLHASSSASSRSSPAQVPHKFCTSSAHMLPKLWHKSCRNRDLELSSPTIQFVFLLRRVLLWELSTILGDS